MNFDFLKPRVVAILSQNDTDITARLTQLCEELKNNVSNYDWVGFYLHKQAEKELQLVAFSGKPTTHETIPFGKGICGQVALSNQNFVVADVHEQSNYIACSLDVRSEIVVPIFKDQKNIGQIDIDSNTINAFDKTDEIFLEYVNQEVSKCMLKSPVF